MDKEDGVIHTLASLSDPLLELHFNEVWTRTMLADAIAKELGHRSPDAGDHAKSSI